MNSPIETDRGARLFVWIIWAAMLSFALFTVWRYGRNIPVVEDWLLVPPLTGNENIPAFLWRQNSEHRIPLPKLILLSLLKLTHGDFRSGMYFNVITVGAVAALMIAGIRTLRGGVSRFVDAFFPLTLLHLGHWENFFWTWQLTQAFACVLILFMILMVIKRPHFNDPGSAILGGVILVCMPLCGAPGMLAGAFFGPWLTYCAIRNHNRARRENARRWIGLFLICCVFVSATLVVFYFKDLPATEYSESPNFAFTLSIFFKFLGMSMGLAPVAPYTSILVTVLTMASLALILRTFFRLEQEERPRAIALTLMLLTWIFVCFLTALARAGLIFSFPRVGPMSRYVLMFSPVILIPFFIWELYGSPKLKAAVQIILFTVTALLVPINYRIGSDWGKWYLQTYEKIQAEIRDATPVLLIAQRHKNDLAHWYRVETLAQQIKMLHDAKMTIFAQLPDSSFAEPSSSSHKIIRDKKVANVAQ